MLHAKTLSPLADYPAELVVRSSYEPEQPGCRVSRQAAIEVQFVTDLADVVLVTLPKNAAVTAEQAAADLQLTVFAVPTDVYSWVVAQKNLEQLLRYLGQQADLSTGQQSALSGCRLGETGGEAAATIIFASGALAGAAATSLQLCQSTTGIVVIFARH